MSGSITALYLLQSANSGSSTADLFSIISGQGGQAATDPIAALKSAETNQAKNIATQEKDPSTSRDISHFLSVVAKAPDLATLLNDPTARKVFLTANGLGDQTDYVALATKALSSDPSKTGNLASTLSDPRWLGLAQTYNFAANGLSKLKDSTVLSTITSGYAQVLSNQALDQTTPGLSAALDFRSRANTIKSVDQILGDSNLRKVVTTALGLPEQIAFQPIEAQEQAISSRLDITKFSDPAYVEQFTRRFLISNQSSNTSSSSFLA